MYIRSVVKKNVWAFSDFELVLQEPCGSIWQDTFTERKLTPTIYVMMGRFVIPFYMYMDDRARQRFGMAITNVNVILK